jgi:hypothetical protein
MLLLPFGSGFLPLAFYPHRNAFLPLAFPASSFQKSLFASQAHGPRCALAVQLFR